jgi:DNA polymerase-3 subunit gamma/tau
MTVYQSVGDNNPFVSPSVEIGKLAKQFSAEDIQLFYQIALKGCEEIHLAPTLSIGFNMTMLRMLIFRPTKQATPPFVELKQKEIIQPSTTKIHDIGELPIQEQLISSSEKVVVDNYAPATINEQDISWANLIPKLQLTGLSLNAVENAEFISKIDQEITLAVAKGHQSLFTPTTIKRIETALAAYYKNPVTLNFSNEIATGTSPAQQKIQAIAQKQQIAEEALMQDPHFLKIKQDFSAELVKNSIVPLKNDI